MGKRTLLLIAAAALAGVLPAGAQANVHLKSPDPNGTQTLQQATAAAAVHNYLQAWEGFRSAFEQNRADLLNRDFIGDAKDKLSQTIQQQTAIGIHTIYQDRSHDVQIVFYSPEGLSLELIDDVAYDVQLIDQEKRTTTQQVTARYVTVMTPTETKWRVRVFQAVPK
jgi:hypothetical protein